MYIYQYAFWIKVYQAEWNRETIGNNLLITQKEQKQDLFLLLSKKKVPKYSWMDSGCKYDIKQENVIM